MAHSLNLEIMKKNMGKIDRIIRTVIALVVTVLYLTNSISGTLGLVLFIVGLVFLATSFIQTCPLYLPFGISTLKKQK